MLRAWFNSPPTGCRLTHCYRSIPGRAQRRKASACLEMSWYVMVGKEIWHLNGYTSPPTAAIRVSARRPPRSGFPLADRRDPSFHSPPPSQRTTLGTKPNEVYGTKNILILSARIWFGPSWLFGKVFCRSNTSKACFQICCNVVDLSIKRPSNTWLNRTVF